MRQLGYILKFRSTDLDFLINKKSTIIDALKQHGLICIPNAKFSPIQILQLTRGIFDQIYSLPKIMAYMNKDIQYPEVCRVGNVMMDGSIKDSSKEAIYYHSDGDFFEDNRKGLFNVMHSVEQPKIGGETLFVDMIKSVQYLKQKKSNVYDKLKKCTGVIDFKDLGDFHLYGSPNFEGQKSEIRHRIIGKYLFNNRQNAYLSLHRLIDTETGQPVTNISMQELKQELHNQVGHYAHKWKHGDLVIWDNMQTIHRSSGACQGRRLIYKCHGRFDYKGKQIMEEI